MEFEILVGPQRNIFLSCVTNNKHWKHRNRPIAGRCLNVSNQIPLVLHEYCHTKTIYFLISKFWQNTLNKGHIEHRANEQSFEQVATLLRSLTQTTIHSVIKMINRRTLIF